MFDFSYLSCLWLHLRIHSFHPLLPVLEEQSSALAAVRFSGIAGDLMLQVLLLLLGQWTHIWAAWVGSERLGGGLGSLVGSSEAGGMGLQVPPEVKLNL